MHIRKFAAVAAALVPLGLAAPGAANADTPPAAPAIPAGSPLLTFVPPKVGPLYVNLGPTIIDGKVISPGVSVYSPGISLPPITYTPLF